MELIFLLLLLQPSGKFRKTPNFNMQNQNPRVPPLWENSPTTLLGHDPTSDLLNPGVQPRAGNPEVTGIPQVDYSTSQRQLTSMQAKVAYLINYPITTNQ